MIEDTNMINDKKLNIKIVKSLDSKVLEEIEEGTILYVLSIDKMYAYIDNKLELVGGSIVMGSYNIKYIEYHGKPVEVWVLEPVKDGKTLMTRYYILPVDKDSISNIKLFPKEAMANELYDTYEKCKEYCDELEKVRKKKKEEHIEKLLHDVVYEYNHDEEFRDRFLHILSLSHLYNSKEKESKILYTMTIEEAKQIIKEHHDGTDNSNIRKFLEAIDIANDSLGKEYSSIEDLYKWAIGI